MQQLIQDFYGMNTSKPKQTKTLDLNKVKEIIFNDIDLLLESFGLEYEQVADNIFMCCPIHEGSDNKQAVSISMTQQVWRCWTRGCQEEYSTDIFGFIRAVLEARDKPSTFSDMLRYVCKLYNVSNARTNQEYKPKKVETPLGDMLKIFSRKDSSESTDFKFQKVETLGHSPYFESRGFKRSTLQFFGVEDCSERQSAMRYRSIIPINHKGKQIGYIARSTRDWLQPKYLFSEGIRKTDFLYNYDNSIEEAIRTSSMFLVEGQGDVWRLHEAGVKQAVGLFGKDISIRQKSLLSKSGVTNLIVLTDNDQAGRESKIKIRRDLGRLFNLIFPKMYTKDIGNMSVEQIEENILKDLRGYVR